MKSVYAMWCTAVKTRVIRGHRRLADLMLRGNTKVIVTGFAPHS